MKVLTLVSIGSYLDLEVINSIILQDFKGENDIFILPYNIIDPKTSSWGQNIVYKQNKAKEILLKYNYTHLFSVEADVLIPTYALSRLIQHNKDVACGIYRLHSHSGLLNGKFAIFRKKDESYIPLKEEIDFKFGDIIEVDFLSFGCTLIKKEVVEAVDFDIGLDLSFSQQCKAKGFSLWADTGIFCIHKDYYANTISSST